MESVILISSDSDTDDGDDGGDSDVELVGSRGGLVTSPRADVDGASLPVPACYVDVKTRRWMLPGQKLGGKQSPIAFAGVALTESVLTNGRKQKKENSQENLTRQQILNKQDLNFPEYPPRNARDSPTMKDSDNLRPKRRRLDSHAEHQIKTSNANAFVLIPTVELKRVPFIESHVKELKTSGNSVCLTRQPATNSMAHECGRNLKTTASNGLNMEFSMDESPSKVVESISGLGQQECNNEVHSHCSDKGNTVTTLKDRSTVKGRTGDFFTSPFIPSSTFPASSRGCFNYISPSHISLASQNPMNQADPTLTSDDTQPLWKLEADEGPNGSDVLHLPLPSVVKTEDMDEASEAGSYGGDLGIDSPLSILWQEGSDGEENVDSRFDSDYRGASREDRDFVCPITMRRLMPGPAQALIDKGNDIHETPKVLCRQSLSLVYSTIDEDYPDGTLQLLSDLLQPGYCPPRDITSHLLRGILLDPQRPLHLCVRAFNLLMRTQRHHIADKDTVPWGWELLASVMTNQRHRCEVVRMLLEYIVQTLEDDFYHKRSISAVNHTIAKATLSCDQHFPQVRDVINWLFSTIVKSTEEDENSKAANDRDEQIRMVSILQRMLSLALEVDRSPALNSAKLSQEIFHLLITNMPLRAHRMLLLESLQSKLLRCKLLEHLLDHACPLKVPLPMSLSLLLHFLKNCTLTPNPMDGTEKWQKWEELIHLLWMLLLSYNKAMKGYLCSSATQQGGSATNLVYKPTDIITKSAIREAVEVFLSRSQADLGQALPLHVEESLMYLQDYLLDVCQC